MLTKEDVDKLQEIANNNPDDSPDLVWLMQKLNQVNQNFLALQRRETILRAALREFL